MQIFDTHAHISRHAYGESIGEVIRRALDSGVAMILLVGSGYGMEGIEEAQSLAEKYPEILPSAGIHPHEARGASGSWLDLVRSLGQAK